MLLHAKVFFHMMHGEACARLPFPCGLVRGLASEITLEYKCAIYYFRLTMAGNLKWENFDDLSVLIVGCA